MESKILQRETETPGVVLIDGKPYSYRIIRSEAHRVINLYKGDGFTEPTYVVVSEKDRVYCTCPDAVYRKRQCKHVQSAVALAGE